MFVLVNSALSTLSKYIAARTFEIDKPCGIPIVDLPSVGKDFVTVGVVTAPSINSIISGFRIFPLKRFKSSSCFIVG
jgi:hypothetical protein